MNKALQILMHLCLFAQLPSPIHAQFPSFPASNAMWFEEVYDGPDLQYSYILHMRAAGHDTLANGLWFNSLWGGLEGPGSVFLGGIRSDTEERVFYYHPNTDSTYLLYDFDPAVGDSMEVWIGDPYSTEPITQWMYVESIETQANNNGNSYKIIGIMSAAAVLGGQGIVDWWIQGVGGTGGLLTTIGSSTVSLYTVMSCMQANDSLWPGGISGSCWLTSIGENDNSTQVVQPNPTSGRITISFFAPLPLNTFYSVFDATGRMLSQSSLATGATTEEIDFTHFGPGTYILRITDPNGQRNERVVVQ